MTVRVGTSGYQYKPWRGSFYSEGCRVADMLAEYGRRLPTVEVNNTFYRMPRRNVLEHWAEQVPEDFQFALKASRRITHRQRLRDCDELLGYLFDNAAVLGAKLGPVLFQLPPTSKKDTDRLRRFLESLPGGVRCSFEFRHPSWFDEDVFDALRGRNAALCVADVDDDDRAVPFISTADWGYLRLRRESYTAEDLAALVNAIEARDWTDTYAYFKHEEAAPTLALQLSAAFTS